MLVTLESALRRIGNDISKILLVFSNILGFARGRGGLAKRTTTGIDRARQVLLGTIISQNGTTQERIGNGFSGISIVFGR